MSYTNIPPESNPYMQPLEAERPLEGRFCLASRGKRLAASILDNYVFNLPAFFVDDNDSLETILAIGGFMIFVALIQCILLSISGQTLAKKMLGMKIVRTDTGENGGFVTNVLKRSILNGLISIIPIYGFVDVLFIFKSDKRCIHDRISGTVVIDV